MSDDGYDYGYGSSYSDLEDLLYDADQGPDLADELASHCVHSPIYAYEPGYELLEYHSDWDYYSDDYYDDDPTILNKIPADGSSLKARKKTTSTVSRGKKRKLVEMEDIPEIDLGERKGLRDCMRGTVWATPVVERDNLYRSEDEKVALLRDWKQRFGTMTQQRKGNGKRAKLQMDESWANDMSLADMGLLNERGSRLDQGGSGDARAADDEDEDAGYEDGYQADVNGDDESAVAEMVGALMGDAGDATPEMETGSASENGDGDEVPLPLHPPKRSRKTKGLLPSPPTSTESSAVDPNGLRIPHGSSDQQAATERGRGQPQNEVSQQSQRKSRRGVNGDDTTGGSGQESKKRKASESPPPEGDTVGTRSVAPGRGKRLASSANAIKSKPKDESAQEATKTRSTRSRKK